MVPSQYTLLLALPASLPHSLLQNGKRAHFASSLFSTTSALFFRSLAESENLTALFSTACALLHKNTGVYPFPPRFPQPFRPVWTPSPRRSTLSGSPLFRGATHRLRSGIVEVIGMAAVIPLPARAAESKGLL